MNRRQAFLTGGLVVAGLGGAGVAGRMFTEYLAGEERRRQERERQPQGVPSPEAKMAEPSPAAEMVEEAWGRLETWCRAHVPGVLDTLNPGASAKEIAALERTLKQPLPADVRKSLTIHNGERRRTSVDFIFGLELLDIDRIAEEWELWSGLTEYNDEYRSNMVSVPAGAIQLDYANASWIPLTKAPGSGNHLGADLAPGSKGSMGQIINFGRDEREKCVLAKNWGEFLLSYARFLESDDFKVIDAEAKSWSVNFDSVFTYVTDKGEKLTRHRHDALVDTTPWLTGARMVAGRCATGKKAIIVRVSEV